MSTIKCYECKFCDAQWAQPGFGYCKIILPPWMGQGTDTSFGGGKIVCINRSDPDGCNLGQIGSLISVDIDTSNIV
jgi:hypothetical protein